MIIGPNNSGKSAIIHSLLALQNDLQDISGSDLRLGKEQGFVRVRLEDNQQKFLPSQTQAVEMEIRSHGVAKRLAHQESGQPKTYAYDRIAAQEPKNFIYPFLSKRKVTSLDEAINASVTVQVSPNFRLLNAKIDRISNPTFLPAHTMYMKACEDILRFPVTTTHSQSGKRAAYTVRNLDNIPLLMMGEGVMNILGLVVDLCLAENQLFLVEEPENDIHPQALKSLLRFAAERAEHNQFIITTHSNIVAKYLGAQPNAKLFAVQMAFDHQLPKSEIREVGKSVEERRDVLHSLGYELFDYDLWDSWLFLEESSAEKIIREYLIPWFAPQLGSKLRTFSAHSISEVEPKFADFNDLFVFLNLTPTYKNKVWVVLDGGDEGGRVVQRLRDKYLPKGWLGEQFAQFQQNDFERYYPASFKSDIDAALATADKQQKRAKKKELLEKVETWIRSNEQAAKDAFHESAAEVIDKLQTIAKSIS